MDIAMIGAGNVGKAVGGAAVRAGHTVTFSATSLESAERAAKETGGQAARSNTEAAERAEIVVIAVPAGVTEDVIKELGELLDGKIVIDTTNNLNEDMSGVGSEISIAERIQKMAPEAKVTKALNYAFADRMADPVVDGVPIEGFVAADDGEAKATVLGLLQDLGLRAIDAGPLVTARSLEHLGALIVGINARNKGSWQNGWKLIGPD